MAHFKDMPPEEAQESEEFGHYLQDLEERTLIYLRDGFSYEVREIADVDTKSHLVFECVPVDDQYKVGAFVVTVPFEEIVRVEVFAVHPGEKPPDMPQITGFRGYTEPGDHISADSMPKPPKSPKPAR